MVEINQRKPAPNLKRLSQIHWLYDGTVQYGDTFGGTFLDWPQNSHVATKE